MSICVDICFKSFTDHSRNIIYTETNTNHGLLYAGLDSEHLSMRLFIFGDQSEKLNEDDSIFSLVSTNTKPLTLVLAV